MESKGPSFYRDHLLLLGEDQRTYIGVFALGDQVTMELELEVVKNLQNGHGGWSVGVMEVSCVRVGMTG